ncbi:hypothetical protein Lalb_Chr06g0171971 [Lupinus albus]|uniref:Uncharacterized protein n=1 Tax=Lupinus albus TaxID=3870 RepID=A0A6A4QEV0_LUPAL|nr:hypothetical protein Lalb_Chr06g0171971 [Lupinus albus]
MGGDPLTPRVSEKNLIHIMIIYFWEIQWFELVSNLNHLIFQNWMAKMWSMSFSLTVGVSESSPFSIPPSHFTLCDLSLQNGNFHILLCIIILFLPCSTCLCCDFNCRLCSLV